MKDSNQKGKISKLVGVLLLLGEVLVFILLFYIWDQYRYPVDPSYRKEMIASSRYYSGRGDDIFFCAQGDLGECYKMADVDKETFIVISSEGGDWAKDEENVYYEWIKLPDADPANFSIIPSVEANSDAGSTFDHYGKDLENVYYTYLKIKFADAETFEPISDSYSFDKDRVYYMEKVIERADPGSFRVHQDGGYSWDGTSVFWKGERIGVADVESFEIISWSDARDKNYDYVEGSVTRKRKDAAE